MGQAFSKAFVEEMKAKLTEERAKLERELEEMSVPDPANPGNFTTKFPEMGTGEDDNAAEVASYGDNIAVSEELKGALKDVISALERVAKGNYGNCRYCKKPIDEQRLRARPASSSCIPCKKRITQEM